jgi:RND superfamily putative drug exporter
MAGESVGGWTEWVSACAVRHARLVIVAWIAIVGGLNIAIPQLEVVVEHDSTSFVPLDAPAVVGLQKMDDRFGNGRSSSFVQIVGHRAGGLSDADQRYFENLAPRLRSDRENVTFVQDIVTDDDVRDAVTSDDGEAIYLTVGIPGATGAPAANAQIDSIRTDVSTAKPAGLDVEVTGPPTTIRDMTHTIESSLTMVTLAVLAVIAIIVQLLYRSVAVTSLILGVVGIALGVGRALAAFAGLHIFGISTFTGSMLTVVVLAAACDYAVFVISRYHEFRREGVPARRAAELAGSRVSGIIIGSALTVAIANAAMLLADVAFFRTTGPAIAVAVLSTLAISITLIPAVLVLAGERGYMEPRPADPGGGFWGRMAGIVVTRPGRVFLAGVVPLALLAGFYPFMDTSYDERGNQPSNTESNRGYTILSDHYPVNEVTPTFVVITSDHDLRTPSNLAALERASDEVSRMNGIRSVHSITRPDGTTIAKGSVGYQAGVVGDRLEDASDDIDEGSADAQKLADGAVKLDDGAEKLDDGTKKLSHGAELAVDGANKLLDGSDRLTSGLRQLAAGAGSATAGSDQLRSGADQLADGLEQGHAQAKIAVDGLGMAYDALATKSLTCGVDPACTAARDGIKQIYEAERDQLLPGMEQAAEAARRIADGSGDLHAGLQQLQSGLDTAHAGAAKVEDGQRLMASKLKKMEKGTRKLHDGTSDLKDGTAKVSDGTQEAADAIDDLSAGLTKASNHLQKLGHIARDPAISGFYLPTSAFKNDKLVTAASLFLSSDNKTARLFVLDKENANSHAARERTPEITAAVRRALVGTKLANAEIEVTGAAPFNVNLHDMSQADFRLVASVALIAVFLILILMLQSVVAPLFLVGSVVLSYGAAMGLGVLVWQDLLGHPLDWSVPPIAFVMLVAVGADYNLLLMKRMQEEAADGARAGIGRALALTGGVITAAGVIFAASMFAMMTASAVGLQQTGFTIGMGLLIDTFIVRTFIVPSAATLLGPVMWWPRKPDVELEMPDYGPPPKVLVHS